MIKTRWQELWEAEDRDTHTEIEFEERNIEYQSYSWSETHPHLYTHQFHMKWELERDYWIVDRRRGGNVYD